jgi:hypothetical protein
MPARQFHINLKNTGAANLHWVTDHLDSGQWTDPWLPSKKAKIIAPGEVGSWRSESNGVMTGTAGWVLFRTTAWDGGKSHGELVAQFIQITWSIPYIGAPGCNVRITRSDPGASSNPTQFTNNNPGTPLIKVRRVHQKTGNQEDFWNEIQNIPELLILTPVSWTGTVVLQHHIFLDLEVSGNTKHPGFGLPINPKLGTFTDLFIAANTWASKNGYIGAYPNFHEANYGKGRVFGTILLKPEAGEFKHVPASEFGFPQTPEARFRAAHDYVRTHGLVMEGVSGFPPKPHFSHTFAGALPTFIDAGQGQVATYGIILLNKKAATWKDIPAADLGNPATSQDRFRAVQNYASKIISMDGLIENGHLNSIPKFSHAYIGGFPNFYEAVKDHIKVYGTIFINRDYADWQDIPVGDLFPGPDVH